jgi:hypothetical protein
MRLGAWVKFTYTQSAKNWSMGDGCGIVVRVYDQSGLNWSGGCIANEIGVSGHDNTQGLFLLYNSSIGEYVDLSPYVIEEVTDAEARVLLGMPKYRSLHKMFSAAQEPRYDNVTIWRIRDSMIWRFPPSIAGYIADSGTPYPPEAEELVEPVNNDNRSDCFWCGGDLVAVFASMKVCSRCKR